MKQLNRVVVVLVPEQPFADWVDKCDPSAEITLDRVRIEPTAYLLHDDAAEDLEGELKRHYKRIWEEELGSWYVKRFWPPRHSYREFCKWFTPQVSTVVFNVDPRAILMEEQ